METIELEVDPETARRYREAGPEERERRARAAVDQLSGRAEARERLFRSISELSAEARENGLTEDILDEILNGDD